VWECLCVYVIESVGVCVCVASEGRQIAKRATNIKQFCNLLPLF